jgi:RND family efflux transporter MFP subunit
MDLDPLRIDRSQSSPRRRKSGGGGGGRLLGALALALVVGGGWLFWQPVQRALDKVRLPKVTAVRVERSHPAAAGAVSGLAANGHIVASRRAALSADTPGRIVELRVEEGMLVEEGQLVARLFDEEYAAALERTQADLLQARAGTARAKAALGAAQVERTRATQTTAAARAAVKAAESDLDFARREHARALELAKINPQRDVDRTRSGLARAEATLTQVQALAEVARFGIERAASQIQVAEADLEVAAARVKVSEAARNLAAATLKKTEVRAPFKGIVVLKDAEVGEVVSPNVQGGGNGRGSVATLVDFSSLEVQADLPETSLSGVSVGASAQIFLDAFPAEAFAGEVSRIWPTANRQTATVQVRVRFAQLNERLRPEMGVRVVFRKKGPAPAPVEGKAAPPLLVPTDALVRTAEGEGVFVLERGVVRFAPLSLGDRRGGQVAVRDGLSEGERVVIGPPADLDHGDRVQEAATP